MLGEPILDAAAAPPERSSQTRRTARCGPAPPFERTVAVAVSPACRSRHASMSDGPLSIASQTATPASSQGPSNCRARRRDDVCLFTRASPSGRFVQFQGEFPPRPSCVSRWMRRFASKPVDAVHELVRSWRQGKNCRHRLCERKAVRTLVARLHGNRRPLRRNRLQGDFETAVRKGFRLPCQFDGPRCRRDGRCHLAVTSSWHNPERFKAPGGLPPAFQRPVRFRFQRKRRELLLVVIPSARPAARPAARTHHQ